MTSHFVGVAMARRIVSRVLRWGSFSREWRARVEASN